MEKQASYLFTLLTQIYVGPRVRDNHLPQWALCSYVIKYILQGCSVSIIFKAYIPTYFINSILCFYFFTAVPKKPSNTVPKIRFLSLDEFASIPKYMKGRLGYDNVNTSIQEFNAALEARYAFLAKGFQAMASMALKKRYKVRFSVNWRFD